MTYTLFFYSQLLVSKSIFYVSLGNIFLLFLWRPLNCGGPYATAQFAPPHKIRPCTAPAITERKFVDTIGAVQFLWAGNFQC